MNKLMLYQELVFAVENGLELRDVLINCQDEKFLNELSYYIGLAAKNRESK